MYWREETRIVAAVSDDQIEVALRLAAALTEPFLLLWVLHTPRGGSQPGRYQSPPLSADEMQRVLREYTPFLDQDGRSDLWIHTRTPAATIVLDRHDLLYAYGPLPAFIDALQFPEGRAAVPSPHAHEYHAQFDELERAFARALDWSVSELRPEDEHARGE